MYYAYPSCSIIREFPKTSNIILCHYERHLLSPMFVNFPYQSSTTIPFSTSCLLHISPPALKLPPDVSDFYVLRLLHDSSRLPVQFLPAALVLLLDPTRLAGRNYPRHHEEGCYAHWYC